MGAGPQYREKVYRAYTEFFDLAERKRRWHPFDDIPWEKLDPALNSEDKAIRVETFCGVELYVPDYTANGFALTRHDFGHAWFQANWGYEESKHGLVFREYLIRSGLRTEEQYAVYEKAIFDRVWELPYPTLRQMGCYGALQEIATQLIYRRQLERARLEGDAVLERIYFLVGRDEAAHAEFYRQVLRFQIEEDPEGTLEDLAHVLFTFRMPGMQVIPGYDDRLSVEGVGLTKEDFLANGVFPTLRKLGTSRSELIAARRRTQARQGSHRGAPDAEAAVEGASLAS